MKCEHDDCDKKAIGKYEVILSRTPKLDTIHVWLCRGHLNNEEVIIKGKYFDG